jgi:hypothetical protein
MSIVHLYADADVRVGPGTAHDPTDQRFGVEPDLVVFRRNLADLSTDDPRYADKRAWCDAVRFQYGIVELSDANLAALLASRSTTDWTQLPKGQPPSDPYRPR